MHFFSYTALLLGASQSIFLAAASPTAFERRDITADVSVQVAAYNALVERFTGNVADANDTPNSASCDVSNAKMPVAPSPLPPPSAGLTLTQVAIGRGTQNFTCATSLATSVPAAAGAVASLFNSTCLAGPFPQLLSVMPSIALKFPVPSPPISSVASLFLSGHHYFIDLTTPFFNLDTDAHSWGTVACKKANATAAPNPKTDVPWLKLSSVSNDGCSISEVYRVNTAGGQPPANCLGMPAAFQVQYAAEYWMFSGEKSSY